MSAIIVSEIIGKEIVFSKTYEDGGTYLEISKIEGPAAVPAEREREVEVVDGVVKIITGSLAIGMVVTPPPVNAVLGVLAGVGALISVGLSFAPDKVDPVQEKLEELTKKIEELDEKIIERFDDMKSFISENKFSVEIIGEVATLKKLMNDVLTLHSKEAIQNFANAYEQNSPLNIAYILMSLLAQRSTNPMAMAMEKDKDKRTETFNTWENIIQTIIGDLYFLEGIACGLLKKSNLYDGKRLIEQVDEINEVVKIWGDKYINGAWNEFKKGLPDYLKSHTHLNNWQKSEDIRNSLQKTCPEHSFYVCITNRIYENHHVSYVCTNPDDFIEVRDQGLCCAFVYRSRKAKNTKKEEFERVQKILDDCGYGSKMSWEYTKTIEQLFHRNLLPLRQNDAGLTFMIYYYCEPAITHTNIEGWGKGPGAFGDFTGSSMDRTILLGLP
uniref:Crystaline entomocidal protoxin n=1 Tax=Caenorhabditis tropicalis TaxID=1561998 RepID=A0A1I7TVU2_9PELO